MRKNLTVHGLTLLVWATLSLYPGFLFSDALPHLSRIYPCRAMMQTEHAFSMARNKR
ncbi:hypothetical protein BDW66DRAFT_105164 [Aspergillus desertorum]